MVKRDKLLKRFRNNPKDVSFHDLRLLLEAFGFELRNVHGSHHNFVGYVGGQKIRISIPLKHPLKAVYVKRVLSYIERIEREEQ
jgi:predicted RNA binding protein YcfA (HicA-like mRNA interferase family)